jgi:c(7)-type cytochrome triheme protein
LPIFPKHEEEHAEDSHGSYGSLRDISPTPPSAARPRMATFTGIGILTGLAALFVIFASVIKPMIQPVVHHEDETASVFLTQFPRKLAVSNAEGAALRLPPDYNFRSENLSPGAVTFSHTRHVARGSEACTNCHPKLYPMRRPGRQKANFHIDRRMYGCEACHNGVRAFSVDRECGLCHGQRPNGKPAVPVDFRIPSRTNGIGPVNFSHKRHTLDAGSRCSDCHPKPYGMSQPGATFASISALDTRMAKGHECQKCHNGLKAFAISTDCKRCHAERSDNAFQLASRRQGM